MITERQREFLLKLLKLRAQTVSEELFFSDMESVTRELTDIRVTHDALNAMSLDFKQCHCGSFLIAGGAYSLTDSNWNTHFLDAPCIQVVAPTPLPVTPAAPVALPEGSSVDLEEKPGRLQFNAASVDDDIPF